MGAFRGEMTPDEAYELLMRLPRDSPLMAALAADPALVSDAEPVAPSWTEFGPEVQALAQVHDLLGSLVAMVGAAFGAKPPPRVRPYPRPANPHEQARRDARWARHKALTARLIPRKEGHG
jgi:hypothetical protein